MGGGNQVHVANRTSWIRRTGVLRPGDGGNVVLPGLSAPAGTHQVLVTGAARGPAHTEGAPAGLTPWPAPAGALVPPSTPLVGQMMIAAPAGEHAFADHAAPSLLAPARAHTVRGFHASRHAGAVAQGAWALPSPTTAAIRGNNAPVPAAPINPSTALKQQLEQQLSVLQAVAAAKAASVGSSSAAPSLWASPPASPAVIAGASPILASASSLLTAKSVAKPSALGLDDAQQRDPVSGGAASPARASSRSYGGNGVLLPGDPSATLRSVDSGGASGAGFALQRVDSPVGRPNLASLSGVAPSLLSSSHGNLLLAPMNSGNLFSAAAAAVSGHAQKASSSYDVVVDGIPARTSVGEEGRGFKSSLGPPKGERASGPEWAIRTSVDGERWCLVALARAKRARHGVPRAHAVCVRAAPPPGAGDVASPRSLTAAASQSFKRRSQRSSLPDFAGGAADPGFSPSSAAEVRSTRCCTSGGFIVIVTVGMDPICEVTASRRAPLAGTDAAAAVQPAVDRRGAVGQRLSGRSAVGGRHERPPVRWLVRRSGAAAVQRAHDAARAHDDATALDGQPGAAVRRGCGWPAPCRRGAGGAWRNSAWHGTNARAVRGSRADQRLDGGGQAAACGAGGSGGGAAEKEGREGGGGGRGTHALLNWVSMPAGEEALS